MHARRHGGTVLAATLAGLALAHGPAAAGKPELVADFGHTAAITGDPANGGIALGLSMLWNLEQHFRVGVMAFVEDIGERVGSLESPSGEDLGPVTDVHRDVMGGVFRIEGHIATRGFVKPFALATWGMYRVEDDVYGEVVDRAYSAGFGLGAGAMGAINDRHAAGIALRYQQLSPGTTGRYLSATLEWRWGMGAAN